MKKYIKGIGLALACGLAMIGSAKATPLVLSTFSPNFNPTAIYANWLVGTPNQTPTNWSMTATGYGSLAKSLTNYPSGLNFTNLDLSSYTNLQLTMDMAATTTGGAGNMGAIVDLFDTNTAAGENSYHWYYQQMGHHVLNIPLHIPNGGATANLSEIGAFNLEWTGGYANQYTYTYDSLILYGPGDVVPQENPVEIVNFNYFTADGFDTTPWSTATPVSAASSYSLTVSATGSMYKYLGNFYIPGGSLTNLELDITVSGLTPGQVIYPYVVLIDSAANSGTYKYVAGVTNGTYVGTNALTFAISAPFTGVAPNFNLLHDAHIACDAGSVATPFTLTWSDINLNNGNAPVVTPPGPIQITVVSYNSATSQLTLTWTSAANQSYLVLSGSSLTGGSSTLSTQLGASVPSQGATTTTSVTVSGKTGFIRIQQQ